MQQEAPQLQPMFHGLDPEHSGSLTVEELHLGLSRVRQTANMQEVRAGLPTMGTCRNNKPDPAGVHAIPPIDTD